jgi:DNA-binding NarL/FixJ family response regulator
MQLSDPVEGRIRVALVDDQALVRQAVAALLRSELSPDIVLLDLDLGAASGVSFPGPVREAGFKGKILVVTGVDDKQEIARALRAGADAVYLKSRPAIDLPHIIRRVCRGETYVDREFLDHVFELAAGGVVQPAPATVLSNREHAILDAVASGLSNKEIASHFGVSEPAIKAALQRLFAKYGVRTRTQLAAAILRDRGTR